MNQKTPAPTKAVPTAGRQAKRRAALDAIAQAAGWASWSEYSTAVKNGVVAIQPKGK